MSDTTNGFKKIATDSSSKKFFIFIGVVILAVGGYVFFAPNNAGNNENSRLRTVPGGKDTVLGGEVNEVYEEALRQADRQRIEDAKQQGASAIPSIIGNKTQEQNPVELTIENEDPEVVRPGLPQNNNSQEVVQIDIPEPEPKRIPTKIELPQIDKPVITPRPVNEPDPVPQQPAPQPAPQPTPAPAPAPQPQPAVPNINQDLQGAIAAQMAQITATMEAPPGVPETKYFYTPEENQEVEGSNTQTTYTGSEFNSDMTSSNVTIENSENISLPNEGQNSGQGEETEVEFPLPGEILYARMISRANSDAPGPILAEIVQGELAGATAIGTFSVANENLILQFNSVTIRETMSGEEINKNLPINAIAVDTKYIGTALATDVDRHLFERIAVTFGTSFIGGLGELIASSGGTTTTTQDGTTTQNNPELELKDQALSAAGSAVGDAGSMLEEYYGSKPTTVIVESGTPIGLMFLQ
jgi:intracellular multiplication protein IcmE